MAYGSAPTTAPTTAPATAPASRSKLAAAVLLAAGLCATALVATRGPTSAFMSGKAADMSDRVDATIAQYGGDMGVFNQWAASRDSSKESISLPDTEKTEQNTCLNHLLAGLVTKHTDAVADNRGVIGTAFIEENTGKDDYSNARNVAALKDTSYLPVASSAALAKVVEAFMHANEVIEAETWFEDSGAMANARDVELLSPKANQVSAAKAFVEHVKESYDDVTGKCYITDCAPGKGHDFHAKTGGSCTSCVAGTSWNAVTDDQPCADVLASCPTGQGYSRSTTKVADSSCHSCAAGTWSGANDDNACAAHAMTTCPAGEELDMGSAHKDATCAACAAGYWKGGSGTMACEPHSLVVSCPAGQETGLPSSATSDTACIACGAGKYSTGSMTACAEHGSIACGVGSEPGAGTSTAAAICEACPSGKFSASDSTMKCDAHTDISTCAAGSAGKLGTSAEDSSCTPCPEGGKKATVGEGKCMTSGCSAEKMGAPEVAVFNYPGLNGRGIGDSSDENSNLLSAIQNQNLKHGGKYTINDEITSFALSDLADRFASASFFFMTDMESQNPTSDSFLPASACGIISDWVSAGGVILMTGTYGGHDTNFMNKIFGWDLTTTSAGSWSLNAANAAGTSFEGGPASIGSPSATDSIGLGSVPDTKVIYGSHSDATVAVLPYDKGMVIFLGFDFYAAGFANDWGKGMHSAGHQNSDSWATEILPRALNYATVAFGEACKAPLKYKQGAAGADCDGEWERIIDPVECQNTATSLRDEVDWTNYEHNKAHKALPWSAWAGGGFPVGGRGCFSNSHDVYFDTGTGVSNGGHAAMCKRKHT